MLAWLLAYRRRSNQPLLDQDPSDQRLAHSDPREALELVADAPGAVLGMLALRRDHHLAPDLISRLALALASPVAW